LILKVKGWPCKEAVGALFRNREAIREKGRIRRYTDFKRDEVENKR